MFDPKEISVNIRENLKQFFIQEVIGNCPHLGSGGQIKKNCLLILDDRTLKIIDKFMGVIDLVEAGIITIESLSKKRKQVLQFHAVYFVEPSNESLRLIKEDFLDERPPVKDEKGNTIPAVKGPLYDFAHIVFSSRIDDFDIQSLTTCKNLVYALISVRQVNLDVQVFNENLYSLEFVGEEKVLNIEYKEKNDRYFNDLAFRALSALTLARKVENVQLIIENVPSFKTFISSFTKNVQTLVDRVYKTKVGKEDAAPVFMIVLHRGSDMLSPLVRDMTYSSMYFNLLQEIDHKLIYQMETEKDGVVDQVCNLNETDNIWLKFKYRPFFESMKQVSESFQSFAKKNSKLSSKDRAGLQSNDLVEEIRSLPQYQELLKDYSKHLNTMVKIVDKYKENKFLQVFDFEQGIATRQTKTGEPFFFKSIKRDDIPLKDDRIRVALLEHYANNSDMETVGNLLPDTESKITYKALVNSFDKVRINAVDRLDLDPNSEPSNRVYYKSKIGLFLEKITQNKFFDSNELRQRFYRADIYPSGSSSKPFERNCFKKTALFGDGS